MRTFSPTTTPDPKATSGPRTAPARTTEFGPIETPSPSSAVSSICAVGWISGHASLTSNSVAILAQARRGCSAIRPGPVNADANFGETTTAPALQAGSRFKYLALNKKVRSSGPASSSAAIPVILTCPSPTTVSPNCSPIPARVVSSNGRSIDKPLTGPRQLDLTSQSLYA